MGSFGERLRREREMRKISLDEIAAATKIGTRHLRALEEEDFKKLPGGIFNKGFVRAYAHFLGINEDQAVSDYLIAAGEPENQTTEIMVDQLVAQHEVEKKIKAHSRELETINRNETGIPWGAIVGLVLVIVAAAGGWTYYTHYKARVEAESAQQQQAQATQPVVPAEEPRVTAGASQPQEPVAPVPGGQDSAQQAVSGSMTNPSASGDSGTNAPPTASQPATTGLTAPAPGMEASSQVGEGFTVSIRATRRAWISVTADGKHLMSVELTPEDSRAVRAHSQVLVKTGNAGGVEISFNGKPIPPLGAEGEVRSATFTPEGIKR